MDPEAAANTAQPIDAASARAPHMAQQWEPPCRAPKLEAALDDTGPANRVDARLSDNAP